MMLIDEIDAFIQRSGMAESTFGLRAVNDGKFVRRVRAGGDVTERIAARVRAFIRDAPDRSRLTEGPPAQAAA